MLNIKKFLLFFQRPFLGNATFFLFVFFLITIVDVVFQISLRNYKYAVYIIAHGYIYSYITALVISFIKNRILKKFIEAIIIAFTTILFFTNCYCLYTYSILFFPGDIAAIVLGTNFNEILEFFTSYIPHKMIYLILTFVCLESILYVILSRKKSIFDKNKLKYLGFSSFLICGFLSIHYSAIWKELIIGDLCNFYEVAQTPKIKDDIKSADIEINSIQPKNIVFVIGESFSKSHSSLYGYNKNTNPRLLSLAKDSLLMVYPNVKSAGLHTIASFKAMMSTFRPMHEDKRNWYECLTLPTVIHKSDYYSSWISNQSEVGFYDNVISQYAHLCDTTYFVGNKFAETNKTTYDELVLEPLDKEYNKNKNFYFIHLMGSHPDFKKRYPEKFNILTENDYLSLPAHQRCKIAAYDNSIIYNDSVVYSIFEHFKDKEAIVFYFSDHGLDTYSSSDSYIGHAKFNDPISRKAGYDIPFMVYCSPSYKKKFPQIVKNLMNNINKPFITEDLIYTAMDIMGVRFKGNNDVEKYSLATALK